MCAAFRRELAKHNPLCVKIDKIEREVRLVLHHIAQNNLQILAANFQVDFWTAIACATIIAFMGVLAGLAPAARAMAVKPVDAMRDE